MGFLVPMLGNQKGKEKNKKIQAKGERKADHRGSVSNLHRVRLRPHSSQCVPPSYDAQVFLVHVFCRNHDVKYHMQFACASILLPLKEKVAIPMDI